VTDDPRFRRALEFEHRHNRDTATEVLDLEWGRAYFSLDIPEVWDANHLRVESPTSITAVELAAEAERLMSARNLRPRRAFVDDDRVGTKLAPGFEELGWETGRWVFMVLSGPPDRRVDAGEVTEPGLELVRRGRDEAARGADWYEEEKVLEQIRRYHFRLLETARGRDFAIVRDGLAVSFAALYSDGSTAQIEDVGTLERYRGQGLSRAVVQRAIDAAIEDGCDLLFLVADDGDWPKDFYARIGFETVGRIHHFLRRPE
jgi:ribosomal protein S18 acetylase RimI-like enzyme